LMIESMNVRSVDGGQNECRTGLPWFATVRPLTFDD